MMRDHRNAMLGASKKSQDASQKTRIGIVSAYNPSTYCVKVKVQPSGVETGWLPIKTAWVGNGWGMQAGPTIGDQVTLSFQEGDADAGVVLGSLYNNVDQPMAVPSGELWIKHQSGSLLKFLTNGDVQLVTARDLLATIGRNLNATAAGFAHLTAATEITLAAPVINLNGDIAQTVGGGTGHSTMAGDLTVQGQVKSNTEVVAVSTPLHTHAHTNVQPGAGTSGGPTP